VGNLLLGLIHNLIIYRSEHVRSHVQGRFQKGLNHRSSTVSIPSRNIRSTHDCSTQGLGKKNRTACFDSDRSSPNTLLVAAHDLLLPKCSSNPRPSTMPPPPGYLPKSTRTSQMYQQAAATGATQQSVIPYGAAPGGYTYNPPGGQQQPMQVKDWALTIFARQSLTRA